MSFITVISCFQDFGYSWSLSQTSCPQRPSELRLQPCQLYLSPFRPKKQSSFQRSEPFHIQRCPSHWPYHFKEPSSLIKERRNQPLQVRQPLCHEERSTFCLYHSAQGGFWKFCVWCRPFQEQVSSFCSEEWLFQT